MTTYILNTPVLTDYGLWQYSGPVSIEQAKEILRQGFSSAVGHQSSADFLSRLLGMEIPMNRVPIKMKPGDKALILNLKVRLQENQILTRSSELEQLPFELGILERKQ